ncbi:uncharacterized protein [Montipora capricornis]|uniref:uncharacterized protein n=1 Tax=Montipora capricornis TaxID=246305 RepID=UPI0035F199F3
MALTPQSSGNHEIGRLDRETPRVGPIAAGEDNDLLRKLLAEVTAIRKENQELKSEVENLKSGAKRKLFPKPKESDPECSNAVRKVYKELQQNQQLEEDEENVLAFDFNSSFHSPANQAMSRKIVCEVRSVYGKDKWEKASIKDAVHQHWRSTRDDATRKDNNKYEEHRRQVKKNNRLKRKLSRRLSTLQKSTTPLSETDKEKAREILSSPEALKYMSSEDSEDDMDATANGPKPRKVKRLPWERSKLKNIKVRLDEEYFKGLSERQRRTSARIIRTDALSTRPCPTDGPRWAVRDHSD